ncbi:hypothetical protein P3S72_15520 [Pseudomonas sp. D3]|uniref:hypothetical protein n=1 Tax=Pseudomonas sp. D3 TaxID=517398 RepID=UPI0023E40893|nr:hypothetical protein [Pseudomonas sp. D3]WET07935.1 hypothetical protein P3S72_15520 [Pseudomonas sp. D3]
MTIPVTIDSCTWNYFFDNQYDLCVELPPEEFSLFITREVELELLQIPDESHGIDKRPLKEYVRNSIDCRKVTTTYVFGFSDLDNPEEPSRYGGFGQGTFASDDEQDWRQREKTQQFVQAGYAAKQRKKTVLRKDEADVSLAVASLNSILITVDEKKDASLAKKGPIHDAAINGGFVVYVQDVQASGLRLADFIQKHFVVSEGKLWPVEAV